MYDNHRETFGRRGSRGDHFRDRRGWRDEERSSREFYSPYGWDSAEGDRGRWSTRDQNAPDYGGWREDDDYPRRQATGDWSQRHHDHVHDDRHGRGYMAAGGQDDTRPQRYFTGQQSSWAVPTPNPYGSYGAYGSSGYGEDYRDHGYARHRDNDRGFFEKAGDEIASWFGDEDAARRREEDHRGRGPKDYTRSDDRIREDVNDRLTEDWRVDASDVTVSVSQGEVTLSGTVSSRQAKRRAEDVAEDVSGVKHVQNNLRVAAATTGSAFDRNWTQNQTSTAEGGTVVRSTGEKA